jgi:hypothetical protein
MLELAMPAIGNAMAGGNLLPPSLTATLGPETPQMVQVVAIVALLDQVRAFAQRCAREYEIAPPTPAWPLAKGKH